MIANFFIEFQLHFSDYSLELDNNTPIEYLYRVYYNAYETLDEVITKLRYLVTEHKMYIGYYYSDRLDGEDYGDPDYAYIRVYDKSNKTICTKTYILTK